MTLLNEPERIGPYRILERIGAGGMGEVFLAYDERLERRVAIKRIRGAATPEHRERFRREARLAARLNHPAIVHVYDVLSDGEADSIVMEHVEGTNLRQMVSRGPLEPARVLAIAREVARGLEEAHAQGVIHRDLKTENVLVTRTGRAKIADFGVAKRLLADEGEGALTRAGLVLGTYRTMAPEQARGEPADHRSDLFSFGVLLYEALTGRSPFDAGNELASLQRTLNQRQVPVADLVPGIPPELSNLVDHLLEKDPNLRPRSAAEVASSLDEIAGTPPPGSSGPTTLISGQPATWAGSGIPPSLPAPATPSPAAASSALTGLRRGRRLPWLALPLLLAAALGAYWLARRPPPPPLYAAVLVPQHVGSTAGEELLAAGVRAAVLRGLVALEGISPKSFAEVDAVSGPPAAVARAVSADEVLTAQLACEDKTCRVTLSRLAGGDGSVRWAESFEVPADDFHLLETAVASQVRRAYAGHRLRGPAAPLAVGGEDLGALLALRRRFDAREPAEPLLAELATIRRRAPRFPEVHLLEAEILRYRFFNSREPEDFKQALAAAERARELAPDSPQPLLMLFFVALEGGDLDRAGETLAEMERLTPGDAAVEESRAYLLRARGEPVQALQVMRTAAGRNPSWKRLYNLALMEYQQGEIAAARGHLEQSLARAPGNYGALSYLAQIEMTNGDPRRAVELYRQLVARTPGLSERSNLGIAYFLIGSYREAEATFEPIYREEPGNPFYALNLADAKLLNGREAEAKELYAKVVELIAADPRASGWQFLTVQAQALAHLGRGREAVAAVQKAQRLAPDDGPAAYEIAVVFALLGERTSALVAAEKALALGYQPRWFDLPWFDGLRSQPEFQDLLSQHAPKK